MAKEKSTTELRDEKKQLATRAQEIINLAKTEKEVLKMMKTKKLLLFKSAGLKLMNP